MTKENKVLREDNNVVEPGPGKYSYFLEITASPEDIDVLEALLKERGYSWTLK